MNNHVHPGHRASKHTEPFSAEPSGEAQGDEHMTEGVGSVVAGGTPTSNLDPRTANVAFVYGDLSGGAGCYGRIYYWYDPAHKLPAVDDTDLRQQFPEIEERDWQQLFYDAFDRGETRFTAEMLKESGLTEDEVARDPDLSLSIGLGRLFGPRPPKKQRRAGVRHPNPYARRTLTPRFAGSLT